MAAIIDPAADAGRPPAPHAVRAQLEDPSPIRPSRPARGASDASGLRIGARLLDVGSGRVLWSEVYHRETPRGALLGARAELASAIASAAGDAARTASESAG
jgi:hypothetical protein